MSNSYRTFDSVFKTTTYPAGETHISRQIVGVRSEDVIEAHIRDFNGLCSIITGDRLLKRLNVTPRWFVPYFPFARDDRRNTGHDGSELELAIDLVRKNDLDIVIADPHSEVAGQLPHLPQSASVDCFREAGAFRDSPVVIIPDAGAAKKVLSWAGTSETVQCLKTRNSSTGKLSGFQVLTEDLGGKPCIIVDDICDGGGTFMGLAKELKKKNAGKLTLAVTHGLFTKGTMAVVCEEGLCEVFNPIFTFGDIKKPLYGVTNIPFQELYNFTYHDGVI